MNLAQVLDILRHEASIAGSQAAWAEANGVSGAYVSDVLNGRREPGAAILDALGLERAVIYKRKHPPHEL